MDKFVRLRIFILSSLLLVSFLVWQPFVTSSVSGGEKYLTVRFLDVGQGDAIHIVTPDGFEMLIDGDPSASVLRELSKGRSFFDRKIDVVIATHPDTDHVAGLVDVLQRYEVDWLVQTNSKSDSPAVEGTPNLRHLSQVFQ